MSLKKAFTLAEVLITLGIIGVVAAMTLPVLFNSIEKIITVNKLKRAMAEVNQGYRMGFTENGAMTERDLTNVTPKDYFDTYWKPYFKVSQFCLTGPECGYATNKPFKSKNGTRNATLMTQRSNVSYITNNGFFYLFQPRAGVSGNIAQHTILVDINGSKLPNTFCKDVFIFRVTADGSMFMPAGYGLSDSAIANGGTYGDYCAELIRRANWKITKDYPW